LSTREGQITVMVALAAAVVAVLASAEPTGYRWWDAFLRAALAFGVVWSAPRSAPLALAAVALAPLAFILHSIWAVVVVIAGLLAFAHLWLGRDGLRRIAPGLELLWPPVVAALGVQGLLRMDAGWFFGFETLLAAVVILALVVTSWFLSRDGSPSMAPALLGGVAVIGCLLLGVTLFVAQQAGDNASDATYAAERGIAAARAGEPANAARLLGIAEESFATAGTRLDSWWMRPGLLVPIVSQNVRAARDASVVGSALSRTAADVAGSLDPSEMSSGDGLIDLAAVAAAQPQLAAAVQTVDASQLTLAGVDHRWLLPALSDGLRSADADLLELEDEATAAAAAFEVLPTMLGSERPQRYFVMFASPAEARELGGFMASWALLEADQGAISQLDSGHWTELTERSSVGALDHPDGYPDFFETIDPANFPANLPSMPDIAEVARAVSDLLPTFQGAPIDGALYIDPFGLEAILEVVGPITPLGLDEPVEASNIADFLLRGQYERFDGLQERRAVLNDLLTQVFARLPTTEVPSLGRLGNIFGPVGRGKRLQMVTFDAKVNDFLREVDLLNDFPWPDENDFLSVASINTAPNKLDAWLERDIRYEAGLDADTGRLIANLRVTLTSSADRSLPEWVLGPPREELVPGDHRTQVVVWSPHELNGVEVDGEPVPAGASDAYGFRRYTVTVTVEPGQTREVLIGLTGEIVVPEDYNLILAHYPGANIDDFDVRVVRSDGVGVVAEFPMVEDVFLSISRPDDGPRPY